ncbi:MAG: hypothetical protein A2161_11795 [Candidatus Schekmanbacteria bacterium RBG_13_48_7]|uniref:Uncharacterized protein n=1 Tax=Candidatus Schekmanbacteria bacterium RBG_13_48_7 TaxID=1817878 RepID=A0A1F7RNA8_9BACT|nr:MAG: hypothetical protein A2161_11795 [Candidatus Schekmanbacteria bacterium RBG_13_48_7]
MKGKLLAGAYPGAARIPESRQKLENLLECGIRHIINLTEQNEFDHYGILFTPYDKILEETAFRKKCTVTYSRHAIRDLDVPSFQTMVNILDEIDFSIGAGNPVYVHCRGGIGRTGTVVGCYLIRKGMATGDDVLDMIKKLRELDPKIQIISPETKAQQHVVQTWHE